jgi:hypothetical protein
MKKGMQMIDKPRPFGVISAISSSTVTCSMPFDWTISFLLYYFIISRWIAGTFTIGFNVVSPSAFNQPTPQQFLQPF